MKKILIIDFHLFEKIKKKHLEKIANLTKNLDCDFVCCRPDEVPEIEKATNLTNISFSEVWIANRYKFDNVCAMIIFSREKMENYKDYLDAKENNIPVRVIRE